MLQPSSSSSSSLSSPHHLPFHGDALFNRYSSREQACPPREGATSLVATVSPLHVASTCAVPAPAPAPGGHSCVFWKMGFGFFSNKNLFKKIHESESPLIPVGTPEEGKPALQPPHPSSTQGEAANTFGEGPAPAWGTPQDQRAEKSLGGWGQWPGCHTCMPCASTPSQQHFGLPATPLPCSHPCSFCDKSKRGHREVPRDHRLLSPSPRGPTGRWGQQPGDATWTPQPMAFGFWSEVFICWGGAAVVVTLLRTPQTNPLGTVVTRYVGYPKGSEGVPTQPGQPISRSHGVALGTGQTHAHGRAPTFWQSPGLGRSGALARQGLGWDGAGGTPHAEDSATAAAVGLHPCTKLSGHLLRPPWGARGPPPVGQVPHAFPTRPWVVPHAFPTGPWVRM